MSRLSRKDKWVLAGGGGALYAPPFPRFLGTPGFWDESYLADLRLPRLFTPLLLSERQRSIPLAGRLVSWSPHVATFEHDVMDGVVLERRLVTERNAFVSVMDAPPDLVKDAFLWSVLDLRESGLGSPWQSVGDVQVMEEAILVRWDTAWPEEFEPDRSGIDAESISAASTMRTAVPVWLAFGADSPRVSHTVNLCQRHDESPRFELSVVAEKFRNGRLPGDFRLRVGSPPVEGLVHMAAHYRPAGERIVFACGTGLSREAALNSLRDAFEGDVVERSRASWQAYFESVPRFASSDPFLTNAYWYRWFGLRLNTVSLEGYRLQTASTPVEAGPFVTEGIGFFRNFVTYSAQAHLREAMWMQEPTLAAGILDTLAAVQREDGSLPGHNYSARPPRDFYHADFGSPITDLFALHPEAVDRSHLGMLRRYADYLLRHRTTSKDLAGPTLYDVFDQNETGQEYMSRYQFASDTADRWASFRVSGIDASVYAERTLAALDGFRFVGSPYGAFSAGARWGLRKLAWDDEAEFFCDVRPDGVRSPARPATGLYGLLVPGLEDLGARAVRRWLASPDEFWLPAGFPATARSDETFDADGEWKGKRLNCPWSGRSWPMANSHLVEGLARLARENGDRDLKRLAGEALMKSVRLMFHEGDPTRPNSYEHYNPLTGRPSLYRGYDDYMHSWVAALILRHVCGVIPGSRETDPLPLGEVEWMEFDGVPDGEGGFFGGIRKT